MIWATDSIGLSTLLFPPQHALDYLEQNPIRLAPATNRDTPLLTPLMSSHPNSPPLPILNPPNSQPAPPPFPAHLKTDHSP